MSPCPPRIALLLQAALLLGACTSEPPPLSDTPTPVILGTTPGSPGRERQPKVRGTAEANSQVRLYLTADCSGEPLSQGTTESFTAEGLPGQAAPDATTYFYVQSTNAWEVTSACSEGYFYVHDGVP